VEPPAGQIVDRDVNTAVQDLESVAIRGTGHGRDDLAYRPTVLLCTRLSDRPH